MNPTQPLFSYGTLQDAELQQLLFDRVLGNNIKAELPGWSLHVGEDGYLFIKPETTGVVIGSVLEMDETALHKTDQWEKAPLLYQREKVLIKWASGGWQKVWAYTRRGAAGTPHAGRQLSLLDGQVVLEAAATLSVIS